MYGAKATASNDFGYAWLPKLDAGQNASWLNLFDRMSKGMVKGFFAWGQNPACSGANAGKVRLALQTLDWMVNVNLFDNEPGLLERPGQGSDKDQDRVFMLPVPPRSRRKGLSAIPAAGCNGATRPSTLRDRTTGPRYHP